MVRDILALLAISLFLAALIQPAADWGHKYKIPRGVTVLFIYLFVFGLTALVIGLMVPTLVDQATRLAAVFGERSDFIRDGINAVKDFTKSFTMLSSFKPDFASIFDQLGGTVKDVFGALSSLFGGIVSFLLVLVIAFYMVAQEKKALTIVHDLVPQKHQKFALEMIDAVQDKMGAWLRGQLLLCLIIGLLYFIGLMIIGIDGALVLAIFGGLTEFIPYLGPFLGGIPIVFVAFISSPFKGLLALLLIILVQQAENHLIVPKVMQKAVGLNPIVSIVAMLAGAKLFGLVGALIAIPLATAIQVIIKEFRGYLHDQKMEEYA